MEADAPWAGCHWTEWKHERWYWASVQGEVQEREHLAKLAKHPNEILRLCIAFEQ